jgi:hypothetical protein
LPYAFIIAHHAADVNSHPQEYFQNVAQSFRIIFVDFLYSAQNAARDIIFIQKSGAEEQKNDGRKRKI